MINQELKTTKTINFQTTREDNIKSQEALDQEKKNDCLIAHPPTNAKMDPSKIK